MTRSNAFKVAQDRTAPHGRVIGIDIIPAQPPRGVSTIQGNFLSDAVQAEVKKFLYDPENGKPRGAQNFGTEGEELLVTERGRDDSPTQLVVSRMKSGSISLSRAGNCLSKKLSNQEVQAQKLENRLVDVVLSDMSEPWEQTTGFCIRSLSDPYNRMMNTSGMRFRDHAGSMVLRRMLLFQLEISNLH